MTPTAWDALVSLVTAPFVLFLLALVLGGSWVASHVERRPCREGHVFRSRHPSGVWVCSSCPAIRDQHGRHL